MSNILKGLRRIVLNPKGNKYLKKYADNKALRGNSPQNPPHKGSTAGSCVSATVVHNILHIYNIERAPC
jgi:hypothetical protein